MWRCGSSTGSTTNSCAGPLVPSGSNLLGLVKHLAAVEYGWFCTTFGRDTEPLPFDDDAENADRVIDEVDIDDCGTAWFGDPVSLRWVLIHMIEETARHAGQMDIMRELIDGATGDHRRE